MKRYIALILALLMCVSMFAACNQTADEESVEPEVESVEPEVESEEPSVEPEDTFEWNGLKEIWSVLPTTQAEGLVVINDTMGAMLEEQGWTYVKKDAEGNPGTQVEFIETAIGSGQVGAIMCAAMDVPLLEDVAAQCKEAGIILVYLGAAPTDYEINGAIYTSYALTGYYAIKMVEAWVEANDPAADDKGVPVALDVYDDIADGRYRSNAFRDTTEASDTLYIYNTNVTYGDDATNAGNEWAQNMMSANPDLRIFVCYEPDSLFGVVAYLDDYCDTNNIDKTEFCVINCYEDEVSTGMYADAVEKPESTVYRGYVTYGDSPVMTGEALGGIFLDILDGTWGWNEIFWDSIHSYAVGFDFVGEWTMGEESVASQFEY